MSRNTKQMEINCYGLTREDLQESVESSLTFQTVGYHSVIMGMLSDAQDAMLNGNNEWARQLINQAKWVLLTYREKP